MLDTDHLPTRLVNREAATKRHGGQVDRLGEFLREADWLADDAVSAMADWSPSERRQLVDCWLATGDASHNQRRVDPPFALSQLSAELNHVPFWVDLDRCSRGGAAFLRTGALGGLALGLGALASSYCSPGGNKPLALHGGLLHSTHRRLVETGLFVYRVSQPGALERNGAGWQALIRVRLLHANVRRLLLASGRWRSDDWGLPINQADMAGTVLLFSFVLGLGVRKLGCRFSSREMDDLMHLWRYAGYLLGVRQELLCATQQEAASLWDLLQMTDGAPDDDSRALISAMFDLQMMSKMIGNEVVARRVQPIYQSICRRLIGNVRADAVGLPRRRWDAAAQVGVSALGGLWSAVRLLPASDALLFAAGNRYWQRFAAISHSSAKVSAPEESGRGDSDIYGSTM